MTASMGTASPRRTASSEIPPDDSMGHYSHPQYHGPPPSYGYPHQFGLSGYPPMHATGGYSSGPYVPGSMPHPGYGISYGAYGPRPSYLYGPGAYDPTYFPEQQSRISPPKQGSSYHGGPGPHHPTYMQHMTSSPPKSSPDARAESKTPKALDNLEEDRLKAAKLAEESLSDVKPIKTDYHFFVLEKMKEMKLLAEQEVRESMKDKGKKVDSYLLNSNLNTRLMRAWEKLSTEERTLYMKKEEDDRRRFMDEEEVASRHCATLTSRHQGPSLSKKPLERRLQEAVDESKSEAFSEFSDASSSADGPAKHTTEPTRLEESPAKKHRTENELVTAKKDDESSSEEKLNGATAALDAKDIVDTTGDEACEEK
jgi:hypothetical protein